MNGVEIYQGTIRHRRFTPIEHGFRYKITMLVLDLDYVDSAFSIPGILSANWPAIGWFRRADYAGNPDEPLKKTISDAVFRHSGQPVDGPIKLLTHLRYWGFIMNPISIFYCYDQSECLQAVVLQVTNTPWKEKVLYVIPVDSSQKKQFTRFSKQMHVSPFNPLEMEYHCRFLPPSETLFLHLENHSDQQIHTDATIVFRRTPCSMGRLILLVLRQPAMTVKTGLGIYWQALRLWIKRSPIYDHPGKHHTKHIHSNSSL